LAGKRVLDFWWEISVFPGIGTVPEETGSKGMSFEALMMEFDAGRGLSK